MAKLCVETERATFAYCSGVLAHLILGPKENQNSDCADYLQTRRVYHVTLVG